MKRIVILGAGPAGLALGLKLLRRSDLNIEVVIIEQNSRAGGMSSSFKYDRLYFDLGSHRLHPAASPELLDDIRELLGSDLLERPRNGRIRLLGNFIKYPLNPLDMVMRLPPSFLFGILRDMITRPFRSDKKPLNSFSDILLHKIGKTICNSFYFPYARKLWGLPPEKIGAAQAQKRVSSSSIGKILRKVFRFLPGSKRKHTSHFLYPSKGFGQICEAMAREINNLGGELLYDTTINGLYEQDNKTYKVAISSKEDSPAVETQGMESGTKAIIADMVFSTIPLNNILEYIRPEPGKEVMEAGEHLLYRGMILLYLVLGTDRFSIYDAHYFPEEDVIFSRISEPKNYYDDSENKKTSGLCVEIPCRVGDDTWNASVKDIEQKVIRDLEHSCMPITSPVKDVFIRRLSHAYPVYDLDFKQRFNTLEKYLNNLRGIISLGRQGLFIHDNIHHAFEMAYAASDCLKKNGDWDMGKWLGYKEQFKSFTVED
ncbi:protoporphyrinogen/coproporphyrinogen oxidase [Thermodesulfobacteriota bacterium]